MTLKTEPAVTIAKGKKQKVAIVVDRSGVEGDLTLRVDAPAVNGIRAITPEIKVPASDRQVEIELDVASTAKVGDYTVKITGSGKDVPETTATIKVTVE